MECNTGGQDGQADSRLLIPIEIGGEAGSPWTGRNYRKQIDGISH